MNIRIALVLSLFFGMLNFSSIVGQDLSKVDQAVAYFHELDSLCSLDDGKMWGVNLYGPTMFVFAENRLVLANEPDAEHQLKEINGAYIGQLPESLNIANTSMKWNGKKWTMLNWDAINANDSYSRAKLLIHESWHSKQSEIGIQPIVTMNAHLDDLRGSILMKVELMALSQALISDKKDKAKHITNALSLRNYRQLLFPNNNENAFELHEGMPEYTGYKLCGINDALLPMVVSKQLEKGLGKDGLANSFPYLSGPAYGLLFDAMGYTWIEDVKRGQSLPELAARFVHYQVLKDTNLLSEKLSSIMSEYDTEGLVENETRKFKHQKALQHAYTQKFLVGDALIIKNNNLNMSFNPQEKLVVIEGGVVYKTMRLTGEWGIAEINNGIYRSNDWQYFLLPVPAAQKSGKIEESDYSLSLKQGWEIHKVKEGKYTLRKKE